MKTLQDYINLAESATDGPWEVARSEDNNERFIVRSKDDWIICDMTFFCNDDETGEHHAQFIAASRTLGPAMAKALIEAERIIRRYSTETPLGHQPHMLSHEAEKALSQIQALNGGEHDKQR